jgi:type I restriction enzyme S subunit
MQGEIRPGYKQTEVGVVPEDWDVQHFESVFRKVPSKAYQIQTSEYREMGLFPIVDQGQKRIVGYSDFAEKLFAVPEGGVIIFGDHTCIVKLVLHDFVVGADGTQILVPKSGHSATFHSFALEHRGIEATGYNRHFKFLKERDFLSPPPEEQRAIAAALADADGLIAALEGMIAKKRDLKQAAMQHLLTGKTRLPGFSGEWEVKRLGEIFDIGSSKRVFQSEWKTQGVPFYRAREIVLLADNEAIENQLFVSRDLYESHKANSGVPEVGDMLVTGVGTLGRVFVVESDQEFYFKDGNIIWFKIRGKMSASFLRQLFLTEEIMRQIRDSAGGSTVGTYTISGAKKTVIPFPSLSEQTAIAEVLSDMDADLAALEAQAAKARAVKQGMMQELLTGRVRLI